MRLLCIGDSPKNIDGKPCSILSEAIKSEKITLYMSGREGVLAAFRDRGPDIAVIQQPEPNKNIIRLIRKSHIFTPIFVISRNMTSEKLIECLDAGADDCGTITMAPNELLSRLKAIVRRAKTLYVDEGKIIIGRLSLNPKAKMAYVDERDLGLTYTEYDILGLLASRRGATTSKENILSFLYAGKMFPMSKSVDVMILRLRRKLLNMGVKDVIKNKWNVGYYLDENALTPFGARREDIYENNRKNETSITLMPQNSAMLDKA